VAAARWCLSKPVAHALHHAKLTIVELVENLFGAPA